MADNQTTAAEPTNGRVTRVQGSVIDVEFPVGHLPDIYNALKVTIVNTSAKEEGEAKETEITLEVEQHLGDSTVRCVALKPTDGLVRGASVSDTGAPISVRVGDVTKGLGAPEFVAGIVKNLSGSLYALLPAVVFIIAAFLGFATGTSWGTFSILLPIVIPVFSGGIPAADLTSELINGNDMLMIAIAATLGGAVMGDHCSPISDTTIMASSGAQCYHLNHVATQLPYAMTVAVVCFANYILASFIQNVVINLAIAIVCMVVVLLVIGKLNHSMNRHSQRD